LRIVLQKRSALLKQKRIQANAWRKERNYPELPDLYRCAFVDYL